GGFCTQLQAVPPPAFFTRAAQACAGQTRARFRTRHHEGTQFVKEIKGRIEKVAESNQWPEADQNQESWALSVSASRSYPTDANVILSGFKTLVHKKPPPNHLAADLLPWPRSRCLSRGDGGCQFAPTRANPHIQRGLDFQSAAACGRIEPID